MTTTPKSLCDHVYTKITVYDPIMPRNFRFMTLVPFRIPSQDLGLLAPTFLALCLFLTSIITPILLKF